MPAPGKIQLKDKYGRVLVETETPESLIALAPTIGLLNVPVLLKTQKKQYTGYVQKSVLDEMNVRTVQVPANFAGLEAVDVPTRLMDQLFEIYDVDEQDEYVEISARHIFYRNLKNNTLWKPTEDTDYTAAAVMRNVMSNAMFESEFDVATDCTDTKPGKEFDFERKNLVECFLDPENGICAKFGLSMIRDNSRFYCLKNVGYDRGYLVESGKNLIGVDRHENLDGVATRVAPYGKDAKGGIVWLDHNGKKYIDSQYIDTYAAPMLELYDTGLQIGKDGVTEQNIQAKLLEAGQKRFSEDEVDKPEVTMTINFIALGDTEEFAQYRGLDKVYLYDILTIRDAKRGYNYAAQVIGVEHDILTGRLISVTIGSIKQASASRKIAVWQVPEVDGRNIRLLSIQAGMFEPGSIFGEDLADHIINYAHFASATIDHLNAEAIEAITAEIETIIAGHITAESIKASAIEAINAKLGTATIEDGYINNAVISYLKVKAATAESLIARDAVTDRYFIDKLQVRNLQSVEATVGNLVVKAADNKYYRLEIGSDGSLTPVQVTPTEAAIAEGKMGTGTIIETDLTVADLSASNIKGINALIDKITASRIDVDELFARSAFIGKLNTTDIESTADLIIKTGGSFTVESGNFSVDSSGNVVMNGTVTAGANSVIGGWTLGAKNLHSGSGAGYVEINSDTSATYALWAGHGTAASAPFSVTRAGAVKATSGEIGGFALGATRLSAGSSSTFVGLDSGTANFDYVFWAGNETASSAPFRLKRDGSLVVTKLEILNEAGTATQQIDLRNYALWKLGYSTVKTFTKSESGSSVTLTIGTSDGDKSVTFNRAATAHLVGGWSGNTYEVYADNDPDVIPVSTTLTGSRGAGTTSGTWTVNTFDTNHRAYAAVAATGVTGNLFGFNIDASGEYTAGTTAGYNSAKLSGSWNGKQWLVTKGTTGANQVGITLSATIAYDTTTHKYTAKANADGTMIDSVASGTQAYDAGVTAGNTAGWAGCYATVGLDITTEKTLGYGESVTVYAQAKATSGASSKTNVASRKITAPADRYQTGYNAGYNQGELDGIASVTISSVEQQGAITYSNGNYSVPAKATASNGATGAGTISFAGTAAYNAGWNACLDACGFENSSFYQGASTRYLYSAPMSPTGTGQNYNIAYGWHAVPSRK